jgi:hypothetical protein
MAAAVLFGQCHEGLQNVHRFYQFGVLSRGICFAVKTAQKPKANVIQKLPGRRAMKPRAADSRVQLFEEPPGRVHHPQHALRAISVASTLRNHP